MYIKVVDNAGRPIRSSVWVHRDERTTRVGSADAVDLSRFTTGDLYVVACGYRPRRLARPLRAATIGLRQGVSVELELPRDMPLPNAPARLGVRLHRPRGMPTNIQRESTLIQGQGIGTGHFGHLGADRVLRIVLPGPGSYIVSFSVDEPGAGDALVPTSPLVEAERPINVTEGSKNRFAVRPRNQALLPYY